MAREIKPAKRKKNVGALPFTTRNYQILALGLIVIVLGYLALGQEPWDSAMPLIVAPILLVLGYCIIIPFGILYRTKSKLDQAASAKPAESTTTQ
ncbi:MAG: hypothetical protein V1799_02235 [bacterium]